LALEEFAVTAVHDGPSGIEMAQNGDFALMLLDVMLPGLSGFDVLRRLRSANSNAAQLPVIMLTARGHAVDRIVGLEVGADDYLPKPFDERELVARMRAILRRSARGPAPAKSNVLRLGDVELDSAARLARRGDETLILTAVEFDMLHMLLRAAGTVVRREEITKQVLDRKLMGFDRSVDTHISRLRRKLGPHPQGDERIKTVRGIGYIYTVVSGES
jgi:two-component system, OmpR family, response regulator CpxR